MSPWEHFMLKSLFWGEMFNGVLFLVGIAFAVRKFKAARKADSSALPQNDKTLQRCHSERSEESALPSKFPADIKFSAECRVCGMVHPSDNPGQAVTNAEQCSHLGRQVGEDHPSRSYDA